MKQKHLKRQQQQDEEAAAQQVAAEVEVLQTEGKTLLLFV